MRIDGTIAMPALPEQVWTLFNDPEALKHATPGCQSMEATGPDEYKAQLTLGIAAIKGSYTGKIRLTEQRPPQHYKLVIEGSGTPGFMSGTGDMDFALQGDSTLVTYVWDVQVGGLIAGVGQRVLGGVAKLLIGQFFQAMQGQCKKGA